MNNNIHVLFYQRKAKNPRKKVSITCRITVNGDRAEFSTKIYCENSRWDSDRNRITGNQEDAVRGNKKLLEIEVRLNEIESDLQRKNTIITASRVQYEYFGGDLFNPKYKLLQMYQDEFTRKKELEGSVLASNTVRRYESAMRNMEYYLLNVLKAPNLFVSQVDLKFLKDYEHWGRTETPLIKTTYVVKKGPKKGELWTVERRKVKWKTNHINKEMSVLKDIVNIALDDEIIEKSPFKKYPLRKEKTKYRFLSEQELSILENHQFTNKRLERLRDVFLFCCYTGLAFVDAFTLREEHITTDLGSGLSCIRKYRVKTEKHNALAYIPLLKRAQDILDKYKDDLECLSTSRILPIISYQKYNDYLKVIADTAGLNVHLTTHVARHTAATYFLNNGIRGDVVVEILGLKSTNILYKIYGKIHNSTVVQSIITLENSKFTGKDKAV